VRAALMIRAVVAESNDGAQICQDVTKIVQLSVL